jgi:hypothetical protein
MAHPNRWWTLVSNLGLISSQVPSITVSNHDRLI